MVQKLRGHRQQQNWKHFHHEYSRSWFNNLWHVYGIEAVRGGEGNDNALTSSFHPKQGQSISNPRTTHLTWKQDCLPGFVPISPGYSSGCALKYNSWFQTNPQLYDTEILRLKSCLVSFHGNQGTNLELQSKNQRNPTQKYSILLILGDQLYLKWFLFCLFQFLQLLILFSIQGKASRHWGVERMLTEIHLQWNLGHLCWTTSAYKKQESAMCD